MRKQEEQSLSEVLKSVFKKNPKLEKGLQEIDIQKAWKALFGEIATRYTNKIKFLDGAVYLHFRSSTLRQEAAYRKREIIDRLNQHIGKTIVKELIIR